MSLTPGEILQDRYRIDGIVGKGGMGAVYKGYDNSLAIPVAIKENLNPMPQAVRQFKREAVMLAMLRHPNLPRVTDHFVVGDLQYLIMDFIEGDDLKKVLERDGAQPESRVAGWLREIAGALIYLHEQNPPIVHRDVKPANIKITPDGKPVLVDFGIAKVAESGHITTTGARSLTPGFSPPEQYGSSQTDARSDQYSLAATVYCLLTGQIPPDSIERTLGTDALTPARELNPQVSPWMDRALIKAMALNASDRFGTIKEFLDAAEGRTPESTVVLPPPEPKTVIHLQATPTIAAVPAAPPPAASSRRGLWLAIAVAVGCLALAVIGGGLYAARGLLLPTTSHTLTSSSVANASNAVPAGLQVTPTPTPLPTVRAQTIQPIAVTTAAPLLTPTGIGGGRLLAFTSNRGVDHRYEIYTLNTVTGEVRQITFDSVDAGRSAWATNGQGLYYESQSNHGHWDIFYISNIFQTGAAPIKIIKDPNDGTHPDNTHPAVSSADGRLAAVSTRNTGQRTIWWMKADGSGLESVSAKHTGHSFRQPSEWDPAWSSDGNSLFLVIAVQSPPRIYRWNQFEQDPRIVTMLNPGQDYTEAEPAISPDGTQMAYARYANSGSEICVSGTNPDQPSGCDSPLTSLGDLASDPNWSPDGLWLAYATRKGGNSEIYRMTISGASKTNLTNDPADDKYPAWQPVPKK